MNAEIIYRLEQSFAAEPATAAGLSRVLQCVEESSTAVRRLEQYIRKVREEESSAVFRRLEQLTRKSEE
jgi:hypothetical protein